MIFKQIHSLPTGQNWEKIAMISLGVIIIGCVAYNLYKPTIVKIEPVSGDKQNNMKT
jgi:hypothetical protein